MYLPTMGVHLDDLAALKMDYVPTKAQLEEALTQKTAMDKSEVAVAFTNRLISL